MKRIVVAIIGIAILTLSSCQKQIETADYQVVPLPKEISLTDEKPFVLDKNTVIGYMGGNPSIETYDRCTNGQHLHFSISEGMFTNWAKAKASLFNPASMVNFPKVGTRFKNRITEY